MDFSQCCDKQLTKIKEGRTYLALSLRVPSVMAEKMRQREHDEAGHIVPAVQGE